MDGCQLDREDKIQQFLGKQHKSLRGWDGSLGKIEGAGWRGSSGRKEEGNLLASKEGTHKRRAVPCLQDERKCSVAAPGTATNR